jgi:hypothetical protein
MAASSLSVLRKKVSIEATSVLSTTTNVTPLACTRGLNRTAPSLRTCQYYGIIVWLA